MSFASEIATLMNANSTINSSVDGIYRETTGTEFNASKNWLIYTYKRNNNLAVVGDKDFINSYTLYTEIYTDKSADTESISDLVRNYLITFKSDTIRDITYVDEMHSNLSDQNENIAFINLMQFDVTYQK